MWKINSQEYFKRELFESKNAKDKLEKEASNNNQLYLYNSLLKKVYNKTQKLILFSEKA